MEILQEVMSFSSDTWMPSLCCILGPLLASYVYFKLTSVKRPKKSIKQKYTVCDSPECVRCSKYQQIRSEAYDKLCDFVKNEEICTGLQRIFKAVECTESSAADHPRQQPNVVYVPGLQAIPWWDKETFQKDIDLIESNTDVILSDYMHIYEDLLQGNYSGWARNTTSSGQWNAYYFYNQGERNRGNCSRCPKTSVILDHLQNLMRRSIFLNVSYSVLHAGTVIDEHYGPTNTRIRCHLGLDVPDGCTLTVSGISKSWEKGKCLIFDDSFLHGAKNKNMERRSRVVLLFDFWHPHLTGIERKALEYTF